MLPSPDAKLCSTYIRDTGANLVLATRQRKASAGDEPWKSSTGTLQNLQAAGQKRTAPHHIRMTATRPSLCTTLITVATAFTLMLLAGVLEVSLSVQPPTWMRHGGHALHDSHPAKMHVQSLSSAQEVLASEETFSRRKLQVHTIACPMHAPLPLLGCPCNAHSSWSCPVQAIPYRLHHESAQWKRGCVKGAENVLTPNILLTV